MTTYVRQWVEQGLPNRGFMLHGYPLLTMGAKESANPPRLEIWGRTGRNMWILRPLLLSKPVWVDCRQAV